jgi:hypothetical protein
MSFATPDYKSEKYREVVEASLHFESFTENRLIIRFIQALDGHWVVVQIRCELFTRPENRDKVFLYTHSFTIPCCPDLSVEKDVRNDIFEKGRWLDVSS